MCGQEQHGIVRMSCKNQSTQTKLSEGELISDLMKFVEWSRKDSDVEGYPLPCDPVTGVAWWRDNYILCIYLPGWSSWQKDKRMAEIIPVLRCLKYGFISTEKA